MTSTSFNISWQQQQIHCHRFGNGERLLIALHGFALTGADFEPVAKVIEKHYTIIAPDLPWHGATEWQQSSFNRNDFLGMLSTIVKTQKSGFPAGVELLGYSYGGRLILSCLPEIAEKIAPQKIWLVAAEGIEFRWGYNLGIFPKELRKLSTHLLRRRAGVLQFFRYLRRFRLISPYTLRFMDYHLKSEANARRLVLTWVSLHDFMLNRRAFWKWLKNTEIAIHLIFGRHDKIIIPKKSKTLPKYNAQVKVSVLNRGHQLLNEQLGELLLKGE